MNTFSKLRLSGWRQFDNVELDLSKNVTVLTGANGTGKTSILNILSTHFGWSINFAATPYVSKRSRKNLFKDIRKVAEDEEPQSNRQHIVGHIRSC